MDELGIGGAHLTVNQTFRLCRFNSCLIHVTYDAEYQRRWYQENKKEHLARVKARNKAYKQEMREFVKFLKSTTPCTDCGHFYPSYVMQFDHIGDDKIMEVSIMVSRMWSRENIQKEIDKCEIVCANCHAVRTYTRRTR